MKKVLVVLLSLCMVLGCFYLASAGFYNDVADSSSYAPAVEVLSGIKILEGDGDGNFRPGDSLKRAEACVILVKLLGYAELGEVKTKTNFSDVPASYWGSGWIATAANLGLIEGYGDGTFGPEDKLTYDQWLTMVLRAMGYRDDVLAGEWPTNFQVKALDLKIVDGTKVGSKEMPRGEVAQVAFNALVSPDRIEYDAKGNIVKKTSETNTFLKDLGATPTTGVVQTGANAGKVGTEYSMDTDGDGKAEVVAFVPDPAYTELTGVKYDQTNGKLGTYTIAATVPFAKTGAIVTDNGKALTTAALTNGETYDAVVKLSDDGKAIAEVASAALWKVTDTIQITKEDVTNIEKALKAAKADAKTITFQTLNWKIADAKALVADDVVTYYANGSDVNKVEVCKDVATGVVTKFDEKTSKYTIGGTAYAISGDKSTPIKAADVKIDGKEYSFFLTAAGDLFAVKKAEEAAVVAKNYAVVTYKGEAASGKTGDPYNAASYTPAKIQLLTADGKTAVYSIDKTYNDTAALAATTFNYKDANDKVQTATYAPGTIVLYNLDAEGEINSLVPADVKDLLKTDYAWNKSTGILTGKLLANNVMVVNKADNPKSTTADDKYIFTVKTVSDLPTDKADLTADVKTVANKDGKYEVLVYEGKASTTEVKNVGLFTTDKYVETFDSATNKTVYSYNVLLNGKADTVTSKAPLSPTKGQLYEITVASDKTVTPKAYAADEVSGYVADASTGLVGIKKAKADTVDTATYYPLATNVVVYVKTIAKDKTETYAVGTQSDLVKDAAVSIYGLNSGKYTIVYITVDNSGSPSV